MSNITERAVAAIGRDDEGADWQLRPKEHAEGLPPEAGALKRVLERVELKELITRYDGADAAAKSAQARYKRIGRMGLYAATIATLVGAFFLFPLDSLLTSPVRSTASALQIFGLIIAFLAARLLALAKPFNAWMQKRAEAEIARVELFNRIVRADQAVHGDEIPLLPLKLEYFRRYQLDVEQRYYRGRGKKHARASWRNNRWLIVSSLITGVVVLLAFLLGIKTLEAWEFTFPEWLVTLSDRLTGPQTNRVMLGLGVTASALYGLGISRSLMDLDERNASRYEITEKNLEFLADTKLAAAREAAASNNAQTVYDFIDEVQALISSEHQEWILLGALERALDAGKLRHAKLQ